MTQILFKSALTKGWSKLHTVAACLKAASKVFLNGTFVSSKKLEKEKLVTSINPN